MSVYSHNVTWALIRMHANNNNNGNVTEIEASLVRLGSPMQRK